MGIKEEMLKRLIELKPKEETAGRLVLECALLKKAGDFIPAQIGEVLELFKGVEKASIDAAQGTMTVQYDEQQINAQQVLARVNRVIDVCIDNLDYIKNNWQNDKENVIRKLKSELK